MATFITRRIRLVAVVAALSLALVGAFLSGNAYGAQTHMSAALGALTTAKADLAAATPDKGGHRDKALDLVNRAIDQVHLGMSFARTH